ADGGPLATPTQDMVLGAHYLTYCDHELPETTSEDIAKVLGKDGLKRFKTEEEVEFAVESHQVHLQEPIEYRWHEEIILTTPGRVIFNVEIERALAVAVHTTETVRHEFI